MVLFPTLRNLFLNLIREGKMGILDDRNRIKELEEEIELLKKARPERLTHKIGVLCVTESQYNFVSQLAIDNIGWLNMSGGLRLAIDLAMESY